MPKNLLNSFLKKRLKEPTKQPLTGLQIKGSKQQIPLKYIQYNVQIKNSLSIVEMVQFYDNPYDFKIETEYYFAISPSATFIELEANINGKTIKGLIKEKEEAKKEYNEALKQGKTAAFAEIVEELHDIMKLNLGNLNANSKAQIKLVYIEQLDITMNKFWKFSIGNTFSSRSVGSQNISSNLKKACSPEQIHENDNQAYYFQVNITIESPSEITFLKSPSHPIQTAYYNNNQSVNILLLQNNKDNKFMPNKQFILFYKNQNINQPQSSLGVDKNGNYAAHITFFPDFNKDSDDYVYSNLQKQIQNDDYLENQNNNNINNDQKIDFSDNQFNIDEKSARAEYIFIIDRSGSMYNRIYNARNVLQKILKMLPSDSYFDIISFGDSFTSLYQPNDIYFQISQQLYDRDYFINRFKTSCESVDLAIDKIKDFEADYGGTNILSPLTYALNSKTIQGYAKNIFLLTDGQVWNENDIAKLVRQHSNDKNLRVYTIGIGNGVSENFIKIVAQEGKGKYEFVQDGSDTDLEDKLKGMMKDSITPFLDQFSLNYDKNIVNMMVPSVDSIKSVRKNEAFEFYLMLDKSFEFTQFLLSCYDSVSNSKKTFVISLNKSQAEQNEYYHKIGAHRLIKQMLGNLIFNDNQHQNLIYRNNENPYNQIILSEATAFVLVDNEIVNNQSTNTKNNQQKNELPQKINIPVVQSVDYNNQNSILNNNSQNYSKIKTFNLLFIFIIIYIFY